MSLPVIATIVEAYRLFFANLTLYARLYWFPVLMQLGALEALIDHCIRP